MVKRTDNTLGATYLLSGDLENILIPSPANEPSRRDNLWKSTCMELFAARRGSDSYFEVNLCPSGHFNAYAFTSYRAGMAPLSVEKITHHQLLKNPNQLEIAFELTSDSVLDLGPLCDIAITAVIEHKDGTRSYWALAHKNDRPDFHRRDSFLLNLESELSEDRF